MLPGKLSPGDEIRVVAPSSSYPFSSSAITKVATNIPVIAEADFGHTTPQFTFPIGGRGKLSAVNGKVSFTILEH